MRVLVIGGGVMGTSSAWSLRARGCEVTLLERAIPGAEASSAAAGILGAQIEAHPPVDPAFRRRLVEAREGYPAWVEALREVSGIDPGFRRCGAMAVAFTADEAESLRAVAASQREMGLEADWTADARRLEPSIAPSAVGAVHFARDAQVEPPQLLRALHVAIVRRGVDVRSGVTVRRLAMDGDRCVGADTDDGRILADAVVLAAGSWTSHVVGAPGALPDVRPVRGQIVLLEERPPTLSTIVFGGGGYLVPRGDGRVLCGSTTEHVGHKREVTAGGVAQILGVALGVAPGLKDAEYKDAWCNFRPWVGDVPPVVGATAVPGLFAATGHYRNGILLAHETGERVAEAVRGG